MTRPIRIALAAALPIALLNLMPTFAIDVGLPQDASWFQQFIALEWIVMHWAGLRLTQLDPYYHYLYLDYFLVFLSGYVEWALLLAAAIYAFRAARSLLGKHAVPQPGMGK